MGDTIRTFIAVKIEPERELLHAIETLQQKLDGEAIKWVEASNMHLTLKFLGDTPIEKVEKIKEKLEKTCIEFQPSNLHLSGIGFFKSNRQPRVLFVNIKQFESLKKVFNVIEELLEELGFERESRAFKPHLTLARIKYLRDRKNFYESVEPFKEVDFQEQRVSEITFYQSILKPSGPVYKPLKKMTLTG